MTRRTIALLMVAGASASALADNPVTNTSKTLTSLPDLSSAGPREGFTTDIFLQNSSWDLFGDPSNDVLIIDVAAAFGLASGSAVDINGFGWDMTITTIGASWLSETNFYLADAADLLGPNSINFAPGEGFDNVGMMDFSSGEVLKLEPEDVLTLSTGMLYLEIYESFDDVADEIDNFVLGTITIQSSVPAPGALALLGLSGAVGARRRRR